MSFEVGYVIDPLYGKYEVNPFILELATQSPEVQRLRGIRLSNIDSVSLLGSSNTSRYEHSLGVAFLAERLCNLLRLDEIDRYHLMAAAMLHDVATPPFGHTVELVFQERDSEYSHERIIETILMGKPSVEDSVYGKFTQIQGKEVRAHRVISSKKVKGTYLDPHEVALLINQKRKYSEFIKKDMDLDNIDNVYRMAYHMGIKVDPSDVLAIISNFDMRGETVILRREGLQYVRKWLKIRELLYSELMQNPADFSAKTMLSRALSIALDAREVDRGSIWELRDAQLLERLHSEESASYDIVDRMMWGDLYCVEGLYWVDDREAIGVLKDRKRRADIEEDLEGLLGKHVILYHIHDKNKSSRPIELQTIGEHFMPATCTLGESRDSLLLGVITDGSFRDSFKRGEEIRAKLQRLLGCTGFRDASYSSHIGNPIKPLRTSGSRGRASNGQTDLSLYGG